jgi:hypothetical protein
MRRSAETPLRRRVNGLGWIRGRDAAMRQKEMVCALGWLKAGSL